MARRLGIVSVVDLSDIRDPGEWLLRREAMAAQGVAYHRAPMPLPGLPTAAGVLALRDLFRRLAYPSLMHGGVDPGHTLVAAVLYRHVRLAEPIELALDGLVRRRQWPAAIPACAFFGQFIEASVEQGIDFFDWVERHYMPEIAPTPGAQVCRRRSQ